MNNEPNRTSSTDKDLAADPWADDTPDLPVKKRRRWPMGLLVLVVLIAGGFGFFWWRGKASATPTTYRTASVSRGDITQSVTANGQITAVKTVEVGSQVSGMITELLVDYNSRVTNGQVIAQLDPSTYQQLLVQAEADLANARAALSLAQMNYRRAKDLFAAEAVSRADYEKAEVDLQQAQASMKSREAQLKKVQVDLERTTIYSPIDGIVISRAVDVGQTVAASLNAPTL
ncbi:MAG: efflux RND transporter periplasmic adaptor subunit, partial [Limisphaerales bacterium]